MRVLWTVGGNHSTRRKPTQIQGEHVNSTPPCLNRPGQVWGHDCEVTVSAAEPPCRPLKLFTGNALSQTNVWLCKTGVYLSEGKHIGQRRRWLALWPTCILLSKYVRYMTHNNFWNFMSPFVTHASLSCCTNEEKAKWLKPSQVSERWLLGRGVTPVTTGEHLIKLLRSKSSLKSPIHFTWSQYD